jgi:hypothetical protein
MSIMRCDEHGTNWDSDFYESCPICIPRIPTPRVDKHSFYEGEAELISSEIARRIERDLAEEHAQSVMWMEDAIAAKSASQHSSDCAVHNMPAYPNGPCDCGYEKVKVAP